MCVLEPSLYALIPVECKAVSDTAGSSDLIFWEEYLRLSWDTGKI